MIRADGKANSRNISRHWSAPGPGPGRRSRRGSGAAQAGRAATGGRRAGGRSAVRPRRSATVVGPYTAATLSSSSARVSRPSEKPPRRICAAPSRSACDALTDAPVALCVVPVITVIFFVVTVILSFVAAAGPVCRADGRVAGWRWAWPGEACLGRVDRRENGAANLVVAAQDQVRQDGDLASGQGSPGSDQQGCPVEELSAARGVRGCHEDDDHGGVYPPTPPPGGARRPPGEPTGPQARRAQRRRGQGHAEGGVPAAPTP